MVKLILSLVVFMALDLALHAKDIDWRKFNSSLLIEVTRPNGVFTCTGVAVSSQIVVTAAHCLDGNIKNVRVFTQEIYNPEQPSLAMKNYKLHPEYNPKISRYHSDLAKIQLDEKLPKSIQIHKIYEGNITSEEFLRLGFGAREERNIRTVVTPIFRKLDLVNNVLELDDKFSRSGDSGGPIFIKNGQEVRLLAIHSTFSFGPEGEYSLNPRLAGYTSWIFEN